MRQIILDTETTGLLTSEGHRIIEIGCIEVVNRYITGRTFHQYIHPQRSIDKEAQAVHGISEDFLADKPVFSLIIDELLDFLNGAELIIHNAPFDVGFLDYELNLAGAKYKNVYHYCTVFDTLLFARKKHPGQQNSLDALCKRYNIDNSRRNYHGALLDASLLAEVYLAMTGGQTSLFIDTQAVTATANNQNINHSLYTRPQQPLPIIYATPEECHAHQDFLNMIKKSSGNCLWIESSTETKELAEA